MHLYGFIKGICRNLEVKFIPSNTLKTLYIYFLKMEPEEVGNIIIFLPLKDIYEKKIH